MFDELQRPTTRQIDVGPVRGLYGAEGKVPVTILLNLINTEPLDSVSQGPVEFTVDQQKQLPTNTQSLGALTENGYVYMAGFNAAVSVAAIQGRDWKSMPIGHIWYMGEYQGNDDQMGFRSRYFDFLKHNLPSGFRMLDIGGQQGSLVSDLLVKAKYEHVEFSADVLDLFLMRGNRWPWQMLNHVAQKNPNYFQGDAHQLIQLPLGKYDVISLFNVTDVMYDPLSVLYQSWEKLQPGGYLVLGRHFEDGMRYNFLPFMVESSDPDILASCAVIPQPPEVLRDRNRRFIEFTKQHTQEFVEKIGDNRFHFDSRKDTDNSGVREISDMVHRLWNPREASIVRYDMQKVLEYKGCNVTVISHGNRGGSALLVHKPTDVGLRNPFERDIVGLSFSRSNTEPPTVQVLSTIQL